jgi:hypothetical protein
MLIQKGAANTLKAIAITSSVEHNYDWENWNYIHICQPVTISTHSESKTLI